MKATGIVCRVDEPGRIVIPKEIRRTLREGAPLLKTLTGLDGYLWAMKMLSQRMTALSQKQHICLSKTDVLFPI